MDDADHVAFFAADLLCVGRAYRAEAFVLSRKFLSGQRVGLRVGDDPKGLLNNNMYNYRGRRIGNVSCEAIVCSSSRDEF